VVIIISLLSLSNFLFAFDRGSLILSGAVGYENNTSAEVSVIQLNPSFLYFIFSKIGIGVNTEYMSIKTKDNILTAYSIGPKIEYHFSMKENRTSPFIGFSTMYIDYKDNYTEYDYQLSIGVTHIIKNSIAITIEPYFTFQQNKEKGADNLKSGNLLGFKFGIGTFFSK